MFLVFSLVAAFKNLYKTILGWNYQHTYITFGYVFTNLKNHF
jgi:hypothetical protein